MPHLLKISKYLLDKVPLKNFSHIMYPTLPHLASYVAQPWGTPPSMGVRAGKAGFQVSNLVYTIVSLCF